MMVPWECEHVQNASINRMQYCTGWKTNILQNLTQLYEMWTTPATKSKNGDCIAGLTDNKHNGPDKTKSGNNSTEKQPRELR